MGLDEAEKHALNDKLREPMRDLVKKYEALQARAREPRATFLGVSETEALLHGPMVGFKWM